MLKRFESITSPFPNENPKKPPNELLAFCLHYSKGMLGPIVVMSFVTGLLAVFEVMLFGFMGDLVDWLANANKATFLEDNKTTLIWMTCVTLVLLPVGVFIHSALVHQTLLGNYPMAIRWQAHRYLLKQSMHFYQEDFAGRVATKVMQTALAVRETVMKLLDVMVYILVYFTAMVVLIASSDWRMSVPMLVWLVVYALLQWYFVPRLKRVSSEQADARSLMTGRIVDSYTNIATVKLFSHNQREEAYAKNAMSQFLTPVYKQMRLATWLNVTVQIANYLLIFTTAALGIHLWLAGSIGVGSLAIAVSLALRLNGMAQWIMWEVSSLFENIGTVVDGMDTLSQTVLIEDKKDADTLEVTHGAIHFNDVDFHYPGKNSQDAVLNQLNLAIQPGEKIALVGRSGAGKSTLVNLLLRFYDVSKGSICIDGKNISDVKQDSLRAHIGMVTQDTSLLHRTVRENIAYGKPDATDDEIIQAAKRAHAWDFIQGLSDKTGNQGLDAMVGERGVKLSGGQRQRIAIARVLLKDAPILILDEATSALDSEIELAIQESLNELMKGKTVIAIAHRLSTIAKMDRLIVLDKGQVSEMGTHNSLIAQNGVYAKLWQHQSGGFLQD